MFTSNITHNTVSKITQVSIDSGWIISMLNTCNEILFTLKRKEILTYATMDESRNVILSV